MKVRGVVPTRSLIASGDAIVRLSPAIRLPGRTVPAEPRRQNRAPIRVGALDLLTSQVECIAEIGAAQVSASMPSGSAARLRERERARLKGLLRRGAAPRSYHYQRALWIATCGRLRPDWAVDGGAMPTHPQGQGTAEDGSPTQRKTAARGGETA